MRIPKKNSDLHIAKRAKKDCFFTTLDMIEDELRFYQSCFKDKIVFCNCNDSEFSNFWKFFYNNFSLYGLKELIATNYSDTTNAVRLSFDGRKIEKKTLNGNGDFRSNECISILKECDICCTNPPFSLFREMVDTLVSNNKKFLVVGNINAMCYRDIYGLFIKRKIWYGASIHSGDKKFYIPDDYPLNASGCGVDNSGNRYIKVKGIRWFTNIRHAFCNPPIVTNIKYNSEKYLRYDNYDAINVDKVKDIPMDYRGNMGVPISFLDKYNPDQFEIVGFRKGDDGRDLSINGKYPYFRVIVKIKERI